MHLCERARRVGVPKLTACRRSREGTVPVPATTAGRLVLVDGPTGPPGRTVVHARALKASTCEVERPGVVVRVAPVVGVDVGARSMAVLSGGEVVPALQALSRYARRLSRLQRQCSRRQGPTKGRRPSKRWRQSKDRLARAHTKVANARVDGLHKLTMGLVKTYGTVVIEDLNVSGLTASAKGSGHWRGKAGLNRALLNCSPAELRRQLVYKSKRYGATLVVADRWYPSSKTCSSCKAVKAKPPSLDRLAVARRTAGVRKAPYDCY